MEQLRLEDYIAQDLLDRFEFYNYNHALEIITQAFPDEWEDIVACLRKLDIRTDDLRQAGGNETSIPKKFDDVLTLWTGEKSEFRATFTSNSTHDKLIREGAFQALHTKKTQLKTISMGIILIF